MKLEKAIDKELLLPLLNGYGSFSAQFPGSITRARFKIAHNCHTLSVACHKGEINELCQISKLFLIVFAVAHYRSCEHACNTASLEPPSKGDLLQVQPWTSISCLLQPLPGLSARRFFLQQRHAIQYL